VAHRYTEFSVLKGFLMQQNPTTAEFKTIQEQFPGKAFAIAYRKSVLERRVEGLGAFLVYFLQNARFCKQTSVDAVCSFLAVNTAQMIALFISIVFGSYMMLWAWI
jgi:hypothetical protein